MSGQPMTDVMTGAPDPAPEPRRLEAPTPRAALAVGASLLVLVLLFEALGALTPFIVGLVLVYLLAPAVDRLDGVRLGRWHLPRWLAILLLYAVIVAVIVVAASVLIRPLIAQIGSFIEAFPRFVESLRVAYLGLNLPDALRGAIDRFFAGLVSGSGGGVDISSLLPIARTLVTGLAAAFALLIAPIWAFYVLKDSRRLTESFMHAIPQGWRDDTLAVLAIFEHTFGRWLRGQLLLGLVVGVATFVGLLVLGELVDPIFLSFAVLLAVIAGIFELIPIIGPILSSVPTLLIALATPDPVKSVVAVAILYIGVQQVENHVLVPKIQGDATELHPSIVILALIVGGALFGFLGAIFAVPVTAAARDIYRYLFRRLSEDDPDVPSPDAPDLARKTGRTPVPGTGGLPEATLPATIEPDVVTDKETR